MNRVIVAIGGTGQMVLHYYTQLFLVGIVRQPFRALVFDTDDFSPSLQFLADYLSDVSLCFGPGGSKEVPSISLHTLKPRNKQGLVGDILVGGPLPAHEGLHHPVQAFFSKKELNENVMQGLYGRPALSAVLALDDSLECLNKIEPGSAVALLTSCLGGTGGGISIPVLWRLENQPGANLLLRAVLLGDYFNSSSAQDNLDDQDNRFRSNRLFFLKALQESVSNLLQVFIEEPKMVRDKAAEKRARNLAWPSRSEPFWRASNALEALLTETIQDAGSVVNNEQLLDWDTADTALRRALGRVQSFLRYNVLDRVRQEAFHTTVWGEDLPRTILSYGRYAGGEISAAAHRIQEEMHKAWRSQAANEYGLHSLFPDFGRLEESVAAVVGCGWPTAPAALESQALPSGQKACERIARLLLFTLMRRGGGQ